MLREVPRLKTSWASAGKMRPFFMYPQAETGGSHIDSFDPDRFKYRIAAKEVS
jgi:hypothetical protein